MLNNAMRKTTKEWATVKRHMMRPLIINGGERLAIWEKVRGMWKDRTPDPIKELKEMRKEWERDSS